jgi:AcrR family transcriptional regulator
MNGHYPLEKITFNLSDPHCRRHGRRAGYARMPRLRADERRLQLITVATRLFAESGYDATTTAAIASAAGVTEPVLYRHFPSKQALFLDVVRTVSRQTLEHFQKLAKESFDSQQSLRQFTTQLPYNLNRLADAQHVLHGAVAISRDRRVLLAARAHFRQMQRLIVHIVSKAKKTGMIRGKRSASVLSWHLVLLSLGYTMLAMNIDPLDENLVDQVFQSAISSTARSDRSRA